MEINRRSIPRMAGMLVRVVAGMLLFAALLTPARALAHQSKELGDYDVEVGFQNEPAIAGQMNAIEFFASTRSGQKVAGLEKTVKFEAQAGGKTRSIDIAPVNGDPGHYLGAFMPTLVGDYVFHMTGKINDLAVDEPFESGPGRFSPVTSAEDVQFPNALPGTDQLAAQIAIQDAKINQAQTFGVVGIVVGVIGIALGGIGLLKRKV
ncbi:MAG TPA: hypothetical protein VGK81_07310 [Anaerolineae bacterium]